MIVGGSFYQVSAFIMFIPTGYLSKNVREIGHSENCQGKLSFVKEKWWWVQDFDKAQEVAESLESLLEASDDLSPEAVQDLQSNMSEEQIKSITPEKQINRKEK